MCRRLRALRVFASAWQCMRRSTRQRDGGTGPWSNEGCQQNLANNKRRKLLFDETMWMGRCAFFVLLCVLLTDEQPLFTTNRCTTTSTRSVVLCEILVPSSFGMFHSLCFALHPYKAHPTSQRERCCVGILPSRIGPGHQRTCCLHGISQFRRVALGRKGVCTSLGILRDRCYTLGSHSQAPHSTTTVIRL